MKFPLTHSMLCLLCVLSALPVMATPSTPIDIHGQLLSSGGTPVSGSRAYTVTFYDAATAGNAIGTALTGNVDVSTDGLFNLSVQPPSGIFTTAQVWYSLGVDTDDPADSDATDDIFPSRIRVYYVPFAVQALRALHVDGTGVGIGSVDDTELDRLDGVTSNVQAQIDAIDTAAITQNTTDIATNAANIATNTTDIASNTADIATNATNIATNTTNIAANTADIATDAANIATNTTDIAANAADIATNATNIATNTTDIATNAANIATNTTDIASNTTAIALKADSADVYTTTAADAKFVELAGDTMSGTLGVDTISEATAANGVVVDGVKLQDNFVELASISAPGDTTGKLYRTGADLFWNGTQLNGGGSATDTDSMHWTGYVYDYGPALVVFKQVLLKSGTIESFQIYCGGAANGTTVDLKVNGASILSSPPAAFVGDSIQLPAVAQSAFTAGDVVEFELDGTTTDVKAVTITLVVEY